MRKKLKAELSEVLKKIEQASFEELEAEAADPKYEQILEAGRKLREHESTFSKEANQA